MKKDYSLRATDSGYIAVTQGKLFYQKFGTGQPLLVIHGGLG